MAVHKAKRRHKPKQDFEDFPIYRKPKFPVYEALYKLNLAFQSLALEIEHLDDYEAVPLSTLQLYRSTAEELRATINRNITMLLHTREAEDDYKYEQLRMKQEKRLRR